MRFIQTIFIILSIHLFSFAQNKDEIKYFARDQIIFDLNYNYWIDNESVSDQKWNSYGCGIYAMYNLLGKNSNICFSSGFGLSMENINMGTQPIDSAGKTLFYNIPSNIDYQKNKISLTYVDIPLEIRIRTNPNKKRKSFKIYFGGKFGYLINNHIKYIGEDFTTGKWIKYKTYNLPNIDPFRYGLTARLGFGKLNLSGYYALNTLFNKNKSNEIYPLNIGISLFLF
jgi:Outer membrane protein beta-barrel domain